MNIKEKIFHPNYKNLSFGIGTTIIFYIILLVFGYSPWGIQSWFGVWIMPLTLYLSLKSYKNDGLDDKKDFLFFFKKGLLLLLIYTAFIESFIILIEFVFDTGNAEFFKNQQLKELYKNEKIMTNLLGKEVYDRSIEEISKVDTLTLVGNDLLNKLLFGFLLVIAYSLVFKDKKNKLEISE